MERLKKVKQQRSDDESDEPLSLDEDKEKEYLLRNKRTYQLKPTKVELSDDDKSEEPLSSDDDHLEQDLEGSNLQNKAPNRPKAIANSSKSNLRCLICSKTFKSSCGLGVHLNSHSNRLTTRYQCDICSEKFYKKNQLSEHVQKHIKKVRKNRNYSCTICDKIFPLKRQMAIHRKTHIKNYYSVPCSLCSAKFKDSDALQKHLIVRHAVHTNGFECKICKKKFKTRDYLKNHMRIHSERKFKCVLCNQIIIHVVGSLEHKC